ncbi:MAG: hypothetical protein ACLGJD_09425 [Gammaproteobacteria bacterium]|jgi:hypothetical protein|uniref:hypothetical protein n=1 Tax=uncultured Pseudacidovorax sp. TaxID=679313 RepID=UPI0025CE4423|nr:hypothetical protein [uncultured Pseudacidovorax sp.]
MLKQYMQPSRRTLVQSVYGVMLRQEGKTMGVERALGVKGPTVSKGVGGDPNRPGAELNVCTWAHQVATEQECQNPSDVKALTGRGSLRDLRQLVDGLHDLETQMVELAKASLSGSPTVGAFLTVHRKAETGHVHLRWRRSGRAGRHLGLDDVHELVAANPTAMRWVNDCWAKASSLNASHLAIRSQLRTVRRQVGQREPALLARDRTRGDLL